MQPPTKLHRDGRGSRPPGSASVALGLGIVLGLCVGAPSQSPPAKETPALGLVDYLADIDQLTRELRRAWAYLEFRRESSGVDLAALEAEAKAAVRKRPQESVFLRVLQRYSAGLKDGHAGVAHPRLHTSGPNRLPLSLVPTREGVMVFAVHPPEEKRGSPRPGDLLLAIDGEPIEDRIQAMERFTPASTDGARRRLAIDAIYRDVSKKRAKLRLRRGERVFEIVVDCPPTRTGIPRHFVPFYKREWRRVGKAEDIALFRPANFRPPAGSNWSDAKPEERDGILAAAYAEYAKGLRELLAHPPKVLILDLRGNPGGTDLLGQRLASHLIEPGFVYYQLQSKSPIPWMGWRRPGSHRPRGVPEKLPRYLGRLIVLLDEKVFSVADNLAACLKDSHPDVTFVGRPAGGGTGAPRAITLQRSGARIWFCTMRVFSPKGRQIEGAGVEPDVSVEWTRDDYLNRRDADLEAALHLARQPR